MSLPEIIGLASLMFICLTNLFQLIEQIRMAAFVKSQRKWFSTFSNRLIEILDELRDMIPRE